MQLDLFLHGADVALRNAVIAALNVCDAAAMREAEGEPIENWAPLIRRAAEIEPDYFFARTGLIKLLAKEGRLEEARTELKPLLELEEMHSSEWRALIMAQIAIAKAETDFPALTRLSEMLRDCQVRYG